MTSELSFLPRRAGNPEQGVSRTDRVGVGVGGKQTGFLWLTCCSARISTASERLQEELSTEGQCCGICPIVCKGT